MVRFIRYWIERNMEDPQLREENARKHLEMVCEKAEELKKQWAQPGKSPGFWRLKETTTVTKQRLSEAEGDLLSPYERALRDLDDSKRAKEEEQN